MTIAVLVAGSVITACSGGSDDESSSPDAGSQQSDSEAAATATEPFDGDDFYAAPDPVPDLRCELYFYAFAHAGCFIAIVCGYAGSGKRCAQYSFCAGSEQPDHRFIRK